MALTRFEIEQIIRDELDRKTREQTEQLRDAIQSKAGCTDSRGAALYLHVSESQVRTLAREGRLASFTVGKLRRFTYAELDAFMARQMELEADKK